MGDLYKVSFTDIACNVSASPGKTIVQLTNPSTQRLRIKEFGVSFDGVTANAVPALVRLMRQSTAGTPSGSTTPTPVLVDAGGPSALQTVVVAGAAAWTAEPTLTDQLWGERIHPQSGFVFQAVLGQEDIIAASGRVGLVVVAAATVNATGYIVWET